MMKYTAIVLMNLALNLALSPPHPRTVCEGRVA